MKFLSDPTYLHPFRLHFAVDQKWYESHYTLQLAVIVDLRSRVRNPHKTSVRTEMVQN